MRSLPARRILMACIISAAAVVAMSAPSVASAEGVVNEECSGVEVDGQGSSLQKLAQLNVWIPDFKSSSDKNACNGKQGGKKTNLISPYNPSGSGAGLRSWGIEPKEAKEVVFGPANAYVGTDEPPSDKQIEEDEKYLVPAPKHKFETLETIPVAQESVAIIVHLPSGCEAKSSVTNATERLVFNDAILQEIFAGTIKTWGGVEGTADGGDTITPTGCSADKIQPVVRFDQSGTTHIFKRYLGLINTATLGTASGKKTWDELSEGSLNIVWPEEAEVVTPGVKGGGELAKYVATNAGTIGYVNLAEARANGDFSAPTGGEGKSTFWAEIENGSKGSGTKVKYTYSDPSSDLDTEKVANANCAKTAYTNGKHSFPPPSVYENWNEVTTSVPTAPEPLKEKDYSLCGMTYELAFHEYERLEAEGATKPEATTVHDYLSFITGKTEGQALLDNNDYLSLPKGEVLTDAADGAKEIGW